MSGRNEAQARQALPQWQAFIYALLRRTGASGYGLQARIATEWHAVEVAQGHSRRVPTPKSLEIKLGRWAGNIASEAQSYPTLASLETFSQALRRCEQPWAWPPVVLLAAGHLPKMVEVLATSESLRIRPEVLAALIASIDDAVQDKPAGRARWAAIDDPGFLAFPEAKNRFRRFVSRELDLAYALAHDFELRFSDQCAGVLHHLAAWARSI